LTDVSENLVTAIIIAYYYSSLKRRAADYFEISVHFCQTRGRYVSVHRHGYRSIKARKMHKILFT